MSNECKTEEDTFDALRRIPRHQLEKREPSLLNIVSSNERAKRDCEKMNRQSRRRERLWKKFSFIYNPPPDIDIDFTTPDNIIESVMAPSMAGTGWTYNDYLKEVNKEIDLQDARRKIVARKRWVVAILFLILFLPLNSLLITFISNIFLKVVVGVGCVWLTGNFISYIMFKIYPLDD